jgi:hypothetical protein
MSKVVNTHKITFAALAAMAVTLSVAMLVSSLATPVSAKIAATDVSCTNQGGQQPRWRINTRNREPKSIRRCTTRTE